MYTVRCPARESTGASGADPATAQQTCLLLDSAQCVPDRFSDMQLLQNGLDAMVRRYVEAAYTFLRLPDVNATWTNHYLTTIEYISRYDMAEGLQQSRTLFVQEATEKQQKITQAVTVILALSLLTIVLLCMRSVSGDTSVLAHGP
jgi:hypothetical protein